MAEVSFWDRFPWLSTTLLTLGMLIPGTINTLAKKAQNETLSIGINGELAPFVHPWFQTFVMYIGEALCFVAFLCMRFHYNRQRHQQMVADALDKEAATEARPLLSTSAFPTTLEINLAPPDKPEQAMTEEEQYTRNPWFAWKFVLPTCCDLLGTTLSGIGLLWVPASIWQMLRGSIIIFAGLLSVLFLKRTLGAQKWFGIGVTAVGLCLVGLSSLLGNSGGAVSGGKLALGVFLVVIAQLFSALQMIVEEAFMKGLSKDKRLWLPMHVVGMEGCYGIVIVFFVCFPITWAIPGPTPGTSYDNPADAIAQMMHSWFLSLNIFIYILSIAFYNFFSLSVAKKLTTVHRTLIDASRTILVWIVDLMFYYLGHYHAFGEAWVEPWSWVQLAGFVVLMLGTMIYNRVITIPWFGELPVQKPYNGPADQSWQYRCSHCTWLIA